MEQLLALEMVRVTEAAAIASARFMGRGEKDEADHAAVEAMRRTMDEIEFAGRIVIGEGERDEAPMLYIGEEVGRREEPSGPMPRKWTSPSTLSRARTSSPTARLERSPSSLRRRRAASSTLRTRISRSSASGPSSPARWTSATRRPRHLRKIADALGRRINDITVVILERPRHEALIAEVREAGARIKLISDGDLSGAISCAVSGTGVHAVMGIGGAPEGVLTAAALRCLGGEIQARFRYRSDEERARGAAMGHGDEDRVYMTDELASGENIVFAATGRDGRRPPPGRPLLRRRRPDPLALDGLPLEAGSLHRHGPHVRPGQPAAGAALEARYLGV